MNGDDGRGWVFYADSTSDTSCQSADSDTEMLASKTNMVAANSGAPHPIVSLPSRPHACSVRLPRCSKDEPSKCREFTAPFGSLEILHTNFVGVVQVVAMLGGPGGTSAHEYLEYRTLDLDAVANRPFKACLRGTYILWVAVETDHSSEDGSCVVLGNGGDCN